MYPRIDLVSVLDVATIVVVPAMALVDIVAAPTPVGCDDYDPRFST